MRIVIIGGGDMAAGTARLLLESGHEVVIIEKNRERIEELSEELDCSFLHGDGSKPHILSEAGPDLTDVLLCLADNDRDNIISSLVGRSMEYKRVVTRIEDPSYETICVKLGLEDTIIPSQTISRYLLDMVEGMDIFELSTAVKGNARFFTTIVGKEDAGQIKSLELPKQSRAICLYREDEFLFVNDETKLKDGDELVILTHKKNLEALRERWQPKQGE